jgi:kumamolisin
VDPALPLSVTLVLRRPDTGARSALLAGHSHAAAATTPAAGTVSDAVKQFLAANHLTIQPSASAGSSLVVTGSAADMSRAFGVQLAHFLGSGGERYISHEGDITLPPEIADSLIAVLGLDQRPVARPHAK